MTASADSFVNQAHEANGWKLFGDGDSASDDSDEDGGLVCRIDKNINKFQGVVLVNLSEAQSTSEIINRIVDKNNNKSGGAKSTESHQDHHDLKLDNKYFTTKVQILETCLNSNQAKQFGLSQCHAVVIYFDPDRLDVSALDKARQSVSDVRGEPRILACEKFEQEEAFQKFKTIVDWCVDNEYEFIPNIFQDVAEDSEDDGGYARFIEALSSYKWPHLKMKRSVKKNVASLNPESTRNDTNKSSSDGSEIKINSDIMKKLEDFDELLTRLNHYRDRPDRANQTTADHHRSERDDEELIEIAQKLSDILGDGDHADLLGDDDSSDDESNGQEQEKENGQIFPLVIKEGN